MSFFNIFLPFNLLLKNFSQYSKAVLDYSESLNNQLQSNECLEIKLNVLKKFTLSFKYYEKYTNDL